MANFTADDVRLMKSNVFYDTYEEVVEFYKQYVTDVWQKNLTICLANTDQYVGLFPKSDIVIIFDEVEHKPIIVTERIFRKNYDKWDWRRIKATLKRNVRVLKHDLGFNLSISVAKDYLDYVHFKEDWCQLCASRNVKGVVK